MQFMILSRGLVAVVGCLAFAGAASDALAQQSSMLGASGATGGSSGAGSGSTMFPSTKFPTAGAAGTAIGTAPGAGAGLGAQQGMGATGQQTGLIGLSSGQLIGTSQAGQTGQIGQNGQMNNRQGQQNRTNANRRTGQNRNQTNQAGAGAGNQQQRSIRPQMVVAFDHPRPDAETTQAALTTRFNKLASTTQFKGINIETDGSRVILRGEVDSERTIRLAAILARMEPGVSKVQNDLTVKEPTLPSPSAVE